MSDQNENSPLVVDNSDLVVKSLSLSVIGFNYKTVANDVQVEITKTEIVSVDTDLSVYGYRLQHTFEYHRDDVCGYGIDIAVDDTSNNETNLSVYGYRLQHTFEHHIDSINDYSVDLLTDNHDDVSIGDKHSRVFGYRLQHAYQAPKKVNDSMLEILTNTPWSRPVNKYSIDLASDINPVGIETGSRLKSNRVQFIYATSTKVNDHFNELVTNTPWKREANNSQIEFTTSIDTSGDETGSRLRANRVQFIYQEPSEVYDYDVELITNIPWKREALNYQIELMVDISVDMPFVPDLRVSGVEAKGLISTPFKQKAYDTTVELVTPFRITKEVNEVWFDLVVYGNIPTKLHKEYIEVMADANVELTYGNQQTVWFVLE